MSVENGRVKISGDQIKFTIPTRTSGSRPDAEAVLEFIVKKGKPISWDINFIPHWSPGALPGIARRVRAQVATLDNGMSQFAGETADSLDAITNAINNSEEF